MNDSINITDIESELASKAPQQILRYALENHNNIAVSFSGAEDVVLIDMAHKIRSDIKVFSLDTGRLHAETYQFIDRVRNHYNIDIDVIMPGGEKFVVPNDYSKRISKADTNPSDAFRKKYIGRITGKDVSRQHFPKEMYENIQKWSNYVTRLINE